MIKKKNVKRNKIFIKEDEKNKVDQKDSLINKTISPNTDNDTIQNNKYKLLFEQSPIGIFLFNKKFIITECNSRVFKVLKAQRVKLIGLDIRTLKDNSILPSIQDSLNGVDGFYEGSYQSTTSETIVNISLRTIPLFDRDGNIIGGVGFAKNTTEQKKIEEELSISDNRYKELSTLTTDAASIITIKPDGTFIRRWMNDTMLKRTGYEIHEIDTFEKWTNIVHPEDLDAYKESIKKILSGEKVSVDFRVIDKKGSVIWINNTVSPEKNGNEKIIGLISAIKDITNQKNVELELIKQRNLLDLIINNAPIGIWVSACDGTYPIINNNFRDAIGYDSTISIQPEELENCYKSDLAATHSNQPIISEEGITFVDGKKHILQVLKTHLKDQDGSSIGVLGISNDITEQKNFEKRQVEAIAKAEEANRLKSAFLANMSHEIRTPLNGIIGFAQYLRDYPHSEYETKHFLDIICDSADHLLNIINDIIDISKIDAGQVKINPIVCNLNKLLDGIYNFFYTNNFGASKKSIIIRLSTSLPDNESTVRIDDFRVKQVLNNLIGNAIKFTQEGSIEFGYTIDETHQNLIFFVRDSGIGIPADKQSIIFERFRQVDDTTTREYGGTGLGLAISKSLVELMGGKIWLESKPEKGSTFYFSIPFNPIAGVKNLKTENYAFDDLLKVCTHKKILVVDDDENSILYLKALLEKVNVIVMQAVNGKQAVDIIASNGSVDLILMDLQLPVMNGYEAIKEIRKINKTVPIIAQTAHTFNEEREICKQVGCNSYITKPIDPYVLYEMICNQLSNPNA